jgi:hypothetical protein
MVDPTDLDAMVEAYKNLGIALNEMNRTIGLLDFLPEVFAKPIREKLRFIHGLTRVAQTSSSGKSTRFSTPVAVT